MWSSTSSHAVQCPLPISDKFDYSLEIVFVENLYAEREKEGQMNNWAAGKLAVSSRTELFTLLATYQCCASIAIFERMQSCLSLCGLESMKQNQQPTFLTSSTWKSMFVSHQKHASCKICSEARLYHSSNCMNPDIWEFFSSCSLVCSTTLTCNFVGGSQQLSHFSVGRRT